MLVLKYIKEGDARFVSHIDLLRQSARILRRADIPVAFSQGFNPHALVFFSPPLPVGIASSVEYIAIDTALAASELIEKYNGAVPNSLKASKVFECAKNPNLQGKIVCADYLFDIEYEEMDLTKFEIEYEKKGVRVKENVSDKIFGAYCEDGKLVLRLATGNVNLRPDRVLDALNTELKANLKVEDVRKIRQFVMSDGKYECVDEYLAKCARA